MSRANFQRELFCSLLQLRIIPAASYEAGPACLAEGDSETRPGNCCDDRLVKVLDRLDEMALPQDDVRILERAKRD